MPCALCFRNDKLEDNYTPGTLVLQEGLMLNRLLGHTLKLGVGPGDNRGVHGPVRLHSVSLVGILVGGGALKWHILVLIPGPMLGHMRLYLVGRILVLHPT